MTDVELNNYDADEGYCGFCGSDDMDPETLVPHVFKFSIDGDLAGFICEDCLEVVR
jgi:hypothetical protein